ncbi:MAG: alpha-galactosidase [Lachnospiraceae bacterium]|nr:alpha-galactosidase [Lachnospiraceae bacterium]
MSIWIDEQKNLITIHTKHSTYQMAVGRYGHLLHLYYGKRLAPCGTGVYEGTETGSRDKESCGADPGALDMRYLLTFYDRGFSGNPNDAGTDRTYSLDVLPQEYPCLGTGDYRSAALQLANEDGVRGCDLRYRSARVVDGKYGIPGLPAVYANERETTVAANGQGRVRTNAAAERAETNAATERAETNVAAERAEMNAAADREAQESQPGAGKDMSPGTGRKDAQSDAAQTLEIILEDPVLNVEVTLLYGVLADSDVITRAARIRNFGEKTVYIEKAASCCVDFLYGEFDLIHFHGRHGMERQPERIPLSRTEQVLQSRRGASSHQQNPFFILASRDAGESAGECYGFQLLYSGNFKGECSVDQYKQTRALLGISDELFLWELRPQERFDTPEAALCYSADGFGTLSDEYHRLIRHHVCRGVWKEKRRPVLINSWEATYFDFDADRLVRIAKQASELGVEMLVLDDGWFGRRDSDDSGLGDWYVNEKKLGCTLGEVAGRVNALGMKFGLWIEPEMVSEDSDLYREHPDWAFAIPGRAPVRGRHQYVLDFSRKEVEEHILSQISEVISHANIEYIKMDMNRHLSDIYSLTARTQNQGATLHRYVLGVYDFLERLEARFPELLIEGCAGGGGRFDAGMLYYTPQIWCSDNTDAIERLRIQYGTSLGYPISAVGSHVSAVPNHQTGRSTDIVTRGVVAMAGTFGYELDLNLISGEEKEIVRRQIQDYIRYSDLIREGHYWRLSDPMENEEYTAWEFSSEDGSEALLSLIKTGAHCNAPVEYVQLRGLDPNGWYRLTETESTTYGREKNAGNAMPADEQRLYPGSALMSAGLPIPWMNGENQAWQVYAVRV